MITYLFYSFTVVTCPKLRLPENGYLVKASACSNVIHAACGIRCRIGFYLTGDSIRLCGKDGNWSLKQVTNGEILPENCSGPGKVAFATNCTITCKKGFVLEGPHSRYCGGRSGVWTQRQM